MKWTFKYRLKQIDQLDLQMVKNQSTIRIRRVVYLGRAEPGPNRALIVTFT